MTKNARHTIYAILGLIGGIVGFALFMLWSAQFAHPEDRNGNSQTNLKQIGLAMHNYLSENHAAFPAAAIYDKDGKPLLSWRVAILPYLEANPQAASLFREFHLDEPWDSEHNETLIDRMPDVFKCPFEPSDNKTNYLAVVGDETAFGRSSGVSIQRIRDGLSYSILVVESDHSFVWTKPEDLDFDADNPKKGVGTLRPHSFNVLFADGDTRKLANDIPADMVRAFITINGGEVVSRD